ncbi:MAG: hypothetical protein ABIW79_02210 [Gemmatimonas sp.]
MIRTQIQLPDDLYRRAKRFGAAREMSLAEMTRRGLELLLDRVAPEPPSGSAWRLPEVNGGGLKVELGKLREILADGEEARAMRGHSD